MKFSFKVFLCSLMVASVMFSIGGWLLIAKSFESDVEREASQSLSEFELIKHALLTDLEAAGSADTGITDGTLRAMVRETVGALAGSRSYAVYASEDKLIYSSPADYQPAISASSDTAMRRWTIESMGDRRFLHVAGMLEHGQGTLTVVTGRDVEHIFRTRAEQLRYFMVVDLAMMLVTAVLMWFMSGVLTEPIRRLSRAATRIADGRWSERARIRTSDEIGKLADDFNRMAEAIEKNIAELEDYAREREDFVANFAHELKTPLTSVIGYADLLRSRKLDEETSFEAASFIFSEGRRLEALSLKLMDLIVIGKQDFELSPVNARLLIENAGVAVLPMLSEAGLKIKLTAQNHTVHVESDLLTTLILNLIDNSRKATEPGGRITVTGRVGDGGYVISVRDTGRGMAQEELSRITEAFYMVDKSRSRAQHGAGLGLAIVERIAQLHGATLKFRSAPGKGTTVSLYLPDREA